MQPKSVSFYVHIPFCKYKCGYCAFNTYTGIEHLQFSYTSAVCKELEVWSRILPDYNVVSIYFGGGTPSFIESVNIKTILKTAKDYFTLDGCEITVEFNPEDISYEKSGDLFEAGVNRASVGMQSFNKAVLNILDRQHAVSKAIDGVKILQKTGFESISLDLIYGVPNQTFDIWRNDIEKALNLYVQHFSLYALQYEPKTKLTNLLKQGKFSAWNNDGLFSMYEIACEELSKAGYKHYEISSWAIGNNVSRHNLGYWKYNNYVGIGAGAHSHLDDCEFVNVKSPKTYIQRYNTEQTVNYKSLSDLRKAGVFMNFSKLSGDDIALTELMLNLRTKEGVSIAKLLECSNVSETNTRKRLHELAQAEYVMTNDNIVLTNKGMYVFNDVFLHLTRN